ncbi:MAG: arginine--tRNA ligase [Halobacteriovoraceae bacterium]|nr:arginine--tRNA ligase [Halobacteriovoraceae bacterium]
MKFELHNKIYLELADLISQALTKLNLTSLELEQVYKLLAPPPKANMGDVAFPCFLLAKELKMAPPQAAEKLKECLSESELIAEPKIFGPYLNFYLNHSKVSELILADINSGDFFKQKLVKNAPKTMVEYSQPNTHKELHVGHMRNLCFGDAIVKLYQYAGVETLSTTFPGDVGTHVAKCLWYYKKHNKETPPKERKGAWLGTLYTAANNLLEEQRGTDKEEQNRTELTKILKELHQGQGEYYDLWKETRQWSIELMQDVYKWADVTFDTWYWESDVDASSVSLVEEYYEKGLFVKDQGAIGIDLSDHKLGFCLLLKSDGTGLYATKDLELARKKFVDNKIEKSLYVVDNRQSLHFKQVFKTLELMGFENAKNCEHLQYEMVELTDGAMSSRKGNIIPLQDLIDQMELKIVSEYLHKYQNEWPADEIKEIAHIVASGAIKYGMTRVDSNKKIVFDMDEWLKLDGESGPYIQYTYARINSLVKKIDCQAESDYALLQNQLELNIINQLMLFNQVIQSCLEQNKTHMLCQYLYHLARAYNSFYAECSIARAESEELKAARIDLSRGVARTLKEGLAVLGIKVPERM